MKGLIDYDDTARLLNELHQERLYEIFTAFENKDYPDPILYFPEHSPDEYEELSERYAPFLKQLETINATRRCIFFTPNSMKFGKRKIEFIESFNAIVLDMDSGKEGADKEYIERSKKDNLAMLLNLQLPPTVIVETKNGLQTYWFLVPFEITDNDTHNSLQSMMQLKLGSDPQAIGGERLWRMPGFYHWKDPNDPFLCRIVHSDYNRRYSLKELTHKFGGERKLKELKKKSIGKRYDGRMIQIDGFNKPGDVNDIARGCIAFRRIEQNKAPSHNERLALLYTYINLGNHGLNHIREVARLWNDYNPDITEYNIERAVANGYHTTPCSWMIDCGICDGRCANIATHKFPISFYYHPYRQLTRPFENRIMINPDELPAREEHIELTNSIIGQLEKHGQIVNDLHRKQLLDIAKVMDTPMEVKDRVVPIVIPAVPGIGKTTFIVEYLVSRLHRDPNFGAVLVVERQDTIDDIVQRINGDTIIDGRGINWAFGMKGYEKSYCAKGYPTYKHSQCKTCDNYDCRVKTNFKMQQKYRVVVISQKRLFDMSDTDDLLGALRYWKKMLPTWNLKECKQNHEKHAREVLLIDEKPKLIENVPTDMTMWGTLIAETIQFLPQFTEEVHRAVSMVADLYNKTEEYGKIVGIDPDFKWSANFVEAFNESYYGDNPEYPIYLQNIIRDGGLYNNNEKCTITTIHYSNIYWQDYHTFIYDGTAAIDPDYKETMFQFVRIPDARRYNNLYIHVCMERNLSKDYFEKNPMFIPRIANDVRIIADAGRTYVVCYKAYEEELRRSLDGIANVNFEHYGNTKGANHLVENKNIILIGILHKGETYYFSKNLTLFGDTSFQVRTADKVRRFENPRAEAVKVYEMVTELIQEIFRTGLRIYGSEERIDVYLCTRDANVVNAIHDFFPGSRISRDWEPMALLDDRALFRKWLAENEDKYKTNKKLVREFLNQGYNLTSEDIIDVLGVELKNAARLLK